MKKLFWNVLGLLALAGCGGPVRQSLVFRENEDVFRNPGQGWRAA